MGFFGVFLVVSLACGAGSVVAGCANVFGGSATEGSRLKPLPQARKSTRLRMLVFTRTEGFRHDSIPAAVATLRELGHGLGWQVDHGEDAGTFTARNLARYRLVVFANTTGDVLDAGQERALREFVEGGGGFVGLHSAADTEYGWAWYGELVGAWFASHPPGLQSADVFFQDPGPRAVPWRATDELYNYRRNPRGSVRVVARVDERDYAGGTMGPDHPIAWCRPLGQGRSWYTGLGHAPAMYAEPRFRAHLLQGLRYASGRSGRC